MQNMTASLEAEGNFSLTYGISGRVLEVAFDNKGFELVNEKGNEKIMR